MRKICASRPASWPRRRPAAAWSTAPADLLRDLNREIDKIAAGDDNGAKPGAPAPGATLETAPGASAEPQRPIPVEIHDPPATPLSALAEFVGPLVQPIATAGIVLVFIVFVLLQREDLRDRMIRLFGMNDVHRATAAISDAAKRIGRYLLMQLVVNLLYGIPVGLGLYLIGVPNALLWGLLATVLRFVPYSGPILAAASPIALSLAVDPSWTTPLLTVALFVVLELFTNNVLEPWLYGASTGLSPLALIVAAVFWTTLWGPVGLLLATPLTVCLVVLGRHVPQLHIFEVLLGDTPVLEPDVKFYQRLLAGDPHDAEEVADDMLEERPLSEVLGRIVLPALALAEQDRQRGALAPGRAREIAGWVQEIVDDLAETAATTAEPKAAVPAASLRVLSRGRAGCCGRRRSLDGGAPAAPGRNRHRGQRCQHPDARARPDRRVRRDLRLVCRSRGAEAGAPSCRPPARPSSGRSADLPGAVWARAERDRQRQNHDPSRHRRSFARAGGEEAGRAGQNCRSPRRWPQDRTEDLLAGAGPLCVPIGRATRNSGPRADLRPAEDHAAGGGLGMQAGRQGSEPDLVGGRDALSRHERAGQSGSRHASRWPDEPRHQERHVAGRLLLMLSTRMPGQGPAAA